MIPECDQRVRHLNRWILDILKFTLLNDLIFSIYTGSLGPKSMDKNRINVTLTSFTYSERFTILSMHIEKGFALIESCESPPCEDFE